MNAQLMDQARAAYRAGDFSSAAQLFASAKTADEICGEADHLRGNSLMRLGLSRMPPTPIPPLCAMLRMESPALC